MFNILDIINNGGVMSNDLNLCQFIGRLGKDPETKYMPSGGAVTSFSLACGWKGKESESTEWINIVAFGKLAEIMAQYLSKGSQVYIAGRMKTEKYQDKQGSDKYITKVVADKMQMLGGKSESKSQDAHNESKSNGYQSQPDDMAFDDDIPF